METDKVYHGDCINTMKLWPDGCVHCCVTSPPYWALRDYGTEGQLGLEKTPEEYIEKMVAVFQEVKRVLRDDGTLWLNMGDSYATRAYSDSHTFDPKYGGRNRTRGYPNRQKQSGLKHKDLCGMPWRLAFALQADGWYLRQDIIWHKPNPMPESVRDRCTKAHEYIFLMSKKPRYYYDAEAIKEESVSDFGKGATGRGQQEYAKASGINSNPQQDHSGWMGGDGNTRNKRSVWTITPKPYSEAHFATFPPDLVEPCIKAGTSEKGCCPACGAPWVRMRAPNKGGTTGNSWHDHSDDMGKGNAKKQSGAEFQTYEAGATIGWQPTCKHGTEVTESILPGTLTIHNKPVPCVVLDPFMGSGTVAEVAYSLNRHYLGCDISGEYIELINKRMVKAMSEFALLES
ncbi:hypothetical protein LCGC14_1688780 [marine sediment metagenome]|uniref:site-specific DNA-methyltransferase (cytosine-N(4)-specific) n=1 Tax=marine sediment metagenome TaxID=412755 RepID=A0A0F9KLJ0_9ZZZZ